MAEILKPVMAFNTPTFASSLRETDELFQKLLSVGHILEHKS